MYYTISICIQKWLKGHGGTAPDDADGEQTDGEDGVADRYLHAKKGGYIINLSSTSGIRGTPNSDFYAGSKFALEGITDSMR